MKSERLCDHIVEWLRDRIKKTGLNGFVSGVSGGIDSAVTATLCARTGAPTLCLSLPILQVEEHSARSAELVDWLKAKYGNVSSDVVDLSEVFTGFCDILPEDATAELATVNKRARLRMVALYAFANSKNYFVCGTGNKVEDFGIGFFTKYGDGGVDLSPIGDLVKSEVYQLASHLGVPKSIQEAPPTDGLWSIDRTDEEQIGATYAEIEWAMDYSESNAVYHIDAVSRADALSARQLVVLEIYLTRHNANAHKMTMPPVCEIPNAG